MPIKITSTAIACNNTRCMIVCEQNQTNSSRVTHVTTYPSRFDHLAGSQEQCPKLCTFTNSFRVASKTLKAFTTHCDSTLIQQHHYHPTLSTPFEVLGEQQRLTSCPIKMESKGDSELTSTQERNDVLCGITDLVDLFPLMDSELCWP